MTTTRRTVMQTGNRYQIIRQDEPFHDEIASTHRTDYAAQIVREHNAHAAMVEALEAVNKVASGLHDIPGVRYDEAEAIFNKIQAALRLAKGG